MLPVKDISDPAQVARWAALQHVYLHEMALEDEFPLFLRQFLTYGTGILRHTWAYEEERQREWVRQMADAPPPDPNDDDEAGSSMRRTSRRRPTPSSRPGPSGDSSSAWSRPRVARVSAPSISSISSSSRTPRVRSGKRPPRLKICRSPFHHVLERHEQWMDPEREDWGRLYDHPDWERIVQAGGFLSDDLRASYADRFNRDGFDPDPNSAYTALSKKGETSPHRTLLARHDSRGARRDRPALREARLALRPA